MKASLGAVVRSCGACFLRDHLLRQGDHEEQRSIESIKPLVRRKNKGGRAVASKVGASVIDGREMRDASSGRGGQIRRKHYYLT